MTLEGLLRVVEEIGHVGLPRFGRGVLGGIGEPGQIEVVVLHPGIDAIAGGQAGVADELAGLHRIVGLRVLVRRQLTDFGSKCAGEPHQVAEPDPEGARGLDGDGVVVIGGAGGRAGGRVSVTDGARDAGDVAA